MTSPNGKIRVDPSLLTPRDLQRAKVATGGRNPYELLEDPAEAFPLVLWCLKSRDDPGFTWDQALDTPFADLDMTGEEPDPPTAPAAGPGASPKKNAAPPSSTTPNGSAPAKSSATSTASPPTTTTA